MARNTTQLLADLRELMRNVKYVSEPIQAYIVGTNDAHCSEYLAECDMFRAYISGFTGSAGTAIITEKEACLWTDGRYFLQASQELDSNWTLMKDGLPTTPTQSVYLTKSLPPNSRVGVDPKMYAYKDYVPLQVQLESAGHKLVPISTNLIDLLWKDRPPRPTNPIQSLPIQYSGRSVAQKLTAAREQMRERNAQYLLLTSLDEVAYFLNLRGSDIEYNPVFFAYVLISLNSPNTAFTIFMDPKQFTDDVKNHLKQEQVCYGMEGYDSIENNLKTVASSLEGGYIWCADTTNSALTSLIPKKNLLIDATPVQLMKAIKNDTEVKGMRNAHIKDGAALCVYFSWLEDCIKRGEKVTEISGAEKLLQFRSLQEGFKGCSFATINGSGPNGAIIHYHPSKSTDREINAQDLYLCDSGAQFIDGTTDCTRTMHFGTPTDFQKECYTRVLKGQIKMATSIFPNKVKGNVLDSYAREYLWKVGLDYAHGTGHGIGHYLCVHEGPMEITYRQTKNDPGLEANMFVSNEPGYYQNGEFGIRIEDIVQIVPAKTQHNFNNRGYLTFDTVTLVPKQTKLMVTSLMTDDEIEFINKYHKKCRDVIGPILEKQGQNMAKEWLIRETQPISR